MADIKISELTTLATMADGVLVPVVDGASTKKITGSSLKTYFLNGNSATVTNGVYTTGDQTIGGTKTFSSNIVGNITGNVTGNVVGNVTGDVTGTVTNGVVTTGSYSNPSWITSLSYTKVAPPTTVIRAQRTAGLDNNATWTFTTISGSGTAVYDNNWNGNGTVLITLTGFTALPSVAYVLDNRPEADGGEQDAIYVQPGYINLLTVVTSGTGFLSPGNPNIITNFTPATHLFAYQAVQDHVYDLYFYFKQ